jgi:hypothetical protein
MPVSGVKDKGTQAALLQTPDRSQTCVAFAFVVGCVCSHSFLASSPRPSLLLEDSVRLRPFCLIIRKLFVE